MLITLEHNGSGDHIKASNELKEFLEDEFGITVQIVSSHYDKEIHIYDEDGKLLGYASVPLTKTDYDTVRYIINVNYYQDKED